MRRAPLVLLALAVLLGPALVTAQCLSEQLAPPSANQNYTQYISWLRTLRRTMLANVDYSGAM